MRYVIVLIGCLHRLPPGQAIWIAFWLGVSAVQESMSLNRFWAIWSHFHLVDNSTMGCPTELWQVGQEGMPASLEILSTPVMAAQFNK